MNNIYRVVWNASLGAWIVVSETAKSKTKSQSKTVGTLMSAALLGFAGNIYAAASTGGLGNGTVISASGCTSAASTSSVGGVAVGCGSKAAADSGILDRQNPFNNGTTANLNGINWSSGSGAAGGTTALGSYAEANGGLSTAIGTNAKATEVASVAVGVAALSTGNTSLAIGRQSAATADYAQAIGNVAAATAKGTLAIGHSATATGYRAIAIGSPDIENAASVGTGQQGNGYQTTGQTKATAKDSIAFGGGAQATKDNALAIGAFSESSGEKSVAIGTGAKATANNAVVIGDGASTKVVGGVALGMGATVNGENSAAVGLNSVAEAQTGSSFLTNVAATTQGTVSFGDVSTKRRLTNLADGAIDSDAVTVAQLKKQKVLTDQQGTDTALAFGGGAVYDPVTGGMTQPSYVVNKNADGTGGTTVNNAGAAISNVDSRTTLLENQTWKLQANGDSGTAVAADANVSFNNGKNIKIERNGTDINVATADDVDFKTVAVGGTGGIALNGTTKKISGLAGGVIGINSTEAINGSQLNGAMNSVSSILGGGVSNTAGTVGGTFTVGTKQYNSVAEAIADAGAEVVEGNNISVSKNGNTYTVATAKNVNFDSVTVSGVAINKTSGDITGLSNTNLNAADFASKGRAATEEQLKLVKDARDTTDLFAVKYDQNADGSLNKD
ncbi:MAG: ESPR-type extended signal peptide-containing protein, partial [Acinetobacter sp.]